MPPIDTSALTVIFTWVWDHYGRTIVDKTGKAAWERLRWEDRALKYAQKVQRLYGTMQILGQARPVPLEGTYTAVGLLDRPTAWQRYTLDEMQAEFLGRSRDSFHFSDREKRRDGLEMVKSGENLFILGKPGAGKTTFLKHVALRGVSGDLGHVPIFVGLKQLSDSGVSVFDFVVNEFDVCDFPDAAGYLDWLLKSGKAILLFDGLDEVNVADDARAHLVTDVEKFTRKYDRCQRVITCRLAANEYGFQGYTFIEMADFNNGQIHEFVAKWFSGDEKQRERRDLFLSELGKPESEGLRELARVPLLLALLCLGFEETLKLSSRRAELYEEALDALLKKWDSSRNIRRDEVYRELSLKRKEQMLALVAAKTFDNSKYFIPRKTLAQSFEAFLSRLPDASRELDGDVVLRAIIAQHGLFVERARDIFSFAHLTFQEYFTARYIVENEARGTLPRLIEHYADPRYREIFLMTGAQLMDAKGFFALFLKQLETAALERPAVAALLRRLACKAATPLDGNAAALRVTYLFLILTHARAHTRRGALDRTIDRGINLTLDLARTDARALIHTLAFDYALDHALVLARAHAHELAFDLDLARVLDLDLARAYAAALARSPHSYLGRDIALVNAWLCLDLWEKISIGETGETSELLGVARELVSAAAHQSAAMGEAVLSKRMTSLARRLAPETAEEPTHASNSLAVELQAIMNDLDLGLPTLNDKDWYLLNRYLAGNQLLIDCLDQAVVGDRQAIKDRLLLLPEE